MCLKYITGDEINTLVLMQIMVSRDEGTAMHSAMVEQIARRILNVVMKKAAGASRLEPLVMRTWWKYWKIRRTILDFVSQSAQLLDIGMIRLASIVNKQSQAADTKGKEWIFSAIPVKGLNSSRRFRLFANIGMLFWDITNPGMEK